MEKRRQNLRITKITQVNQWVSCFRVEPFSELDKLVQFKSGQYINFFYEIDGSTTTRAYSIASSPKDAEENFYDIYIHRGGFFTAKWIFQNWEVGSFVEASYPMGEFYFDPMRDTNNIIGISGGMSITPLRSFARAVMGGSLDIKLTLFCGWDNPEDIIYKEEFESYAEQNPNFKIVFAVKSGGLAGSETGYINRDMIEKYAFTKDATFFLCGPREMYVALENELSGLEVPAENYHVEIPGEPKADMFLEKDRYLVAEKKEYGLTVEINGSIHKIIMNSKENILVALERAGLSPSARCRSGACKYCLSKLISGDVFIPKHWDKRTGDEKENNLIYSCCTFPLSDINLLVMEFDSPSKTLL